MSRHSVPPKDLRPYDTEQQFSGTKSAKQSWYVSMGIALTY